MRNFVVALLAASALALSGSAIAQAYPSKTIRIVVPFPVGGIADTFARVIAQKVADAWGQPVIVENKTGAGGNIGADFVAKSPPDGYTIVMVRAHRARARSGRSSRRESGGSREVGA